MPSGYKAAFPGGDTGALTIDGTDSTIYTDPIVVPNGSVFAFQVQYTTAGSDLVTTTSELQETCIPNPVLTTDDDWVTSTDVTIAAAASAAAQELFNVGNLGSAMVRFKFVRSAGSGTVRIYWSIKKTH